MLWAPTLLTHVVALQTLGYGSKKSPLPDRLLLSHPFHLLQLAEPRCELSAFVQAGENDLTCRLNPCKLRDTAVYFFSLYL